MRVLNRKIAVLTVLFSVTLMASSLQAASLAVDVSGINDQGHRIKKHLKT